MVTTTAGLLARAIGAATRPGTSLGLLRDAFEGVGEIAWAGLNPAPETPLNVPIGPHRRFAVVRQQLSEFKEVKDALGGTVNDVVLAVVSGALAEWLHSRGIRTEGLEMRALVPVSVRTEAQHNTLGNQLAVMRGPLPVYIDDPVARLAFVRSAMDGLKESKQAEGAATLAAVNNLAPPTVLAQASRLNFSTRLFNLIVTNIPGPQMPLYVLGRPLEDLFPVAFLPKDHALAIAIMSYNGGIDFGLLGDYDALPDIDLIADGISASLAELLAIARGSKPKPKSRSRSKPSGANGAKSAFNGAPAAGNGAAAPDNGDESAARAKASGTEEPRPILPPAHGRPKRGPAADMRAKQRQRGSQPARKRSSES
jgi:WS/DGAT/MGAT family acyltransferase